MRDKKRLAGKIFSVTLVALLLSVVNLSVILACPESEVKTDSGVALSGLPRMTNGQVLQGTVIKEPFTLYLAKDRQGEIFWFDLDKKKSSLDYPSLVVGTGVEDFSGAFGKLTAQDIKDTFSSWKPLVVMKKGVSLSCYSLSGGLLNKNSCVAGLSLGKNGVEIMRGDIVLVVPDSQNQGVDFFAFVPNAEGKVFGTVETPTPKPTAKPTSTPTPLPKKSAGEINRQLESAGTGLEVITAKKQQKLEDWIAEVAKARSLRVEDIKIINGAEFDSSGKMISGPEIKSRRVGGIQVPWAGISIGGEIVTIPGETTLVVPKRGGDGGLEFVDLEPAILEFARDMGVDISPRYNETKQKIALHDTAIGARLSSVSDVEKSCLKAYGRPCYNFVIDTDGTIYKIRTVGFEYDGAGEDLDRISIAVSFNTSPTYNGGEATAVQFEVGFKLVVWVARKYGISASGIYAHKEVSSKREDPVGLNMDEFRAKVARELSGSSSVASPRPVAVSNGEEGVPTSSDIFRTALWVDAYHSGIESKTAIERLVSYSVSNKVTVLVVQVRKRDTAYFYKGGSKPPQNDFDSLAYLLEKTKPVGIEVQAWVDACWGSTEESPDYTQKVVQDCVKDLVRPLLVYDISGVHLDRIRYSSGATKAKRDALTGLVQEVHNLAKASGKKLSVATATLLPIPDGADYTRTQPFLGMGQDWESWVKRGFVDEVFAMNYLGSVEDYRAWVEFGAGICEESGVLYYSGIPDYFNDEGRPVDLEEYVGIAEELRASGAIFYSYASLVSSGRQLLVRGSYPVTPTPPIIAQTVPTAVSSKGWVLPIEKEQIYALCRLGSEHPAGADRAWDLCAKEGTEIHPIADGTVLYTDTAGKSNLGYFVQVYHETQKRVSTYAHLGVVKVKVGQKVKTEVDVLGTVGWTGATGFGPHLHLVIETAGPAVQIGKGQFGQGFMLDADREFASWRAELKYCLMCNVEGGGR